MPANIDKRSDAAVFIKANPWKIAVVFVIIMTAISSLFFHPAAKAGDDDVVFLPVILIAPLPGSTGKIAHTINSGPTREIYTMNVDGSNRVRLTKNEAVDDMPAWSADGSLIAFTSDRREAGYYEIYTMNRDGSGVVRLTSSQWDDNSPSFSPSGDKLTFASSRSGVFQVFTMNSDGSGQTALTKNSYQSGSPQWSADGSKIVFASSKSKGIEIFAMNPDGSGMERLTTGGGPDFSPAWSPDGKQIVFTSLRDGDRRIYVMNADGSGQKMLTNFYSDWADWSPDGARIVFTRREENATISANSSAEPPQIDAQLLFAHPQAAEASDSNLYTIKPDGSDVQLVTDSPLNKEDRGNWGP